jgi:hypothetical protein
MLATPGYSYFNKDSRPVGGKKNRWSKESVKQRKQLKQRNRSKEPIKGTVKETGLKNWLKKPVKETG